MVHAVGFAALQRAHLVRAEPRGAPAQVRGYGPEVADEFGGVEDRPRAPERTGQLVVLRQRPAEQLGRHLAVAHLGDQQVEQLLPDLVAGLVVGRPGIGASNAAAHSAGAQPHVGPLRLDGIPVDGGSS
jgi:hypothetical protein